MKLLFAEPWLLSQLLSFCAFLLIVASFQLRKRGQILLCLLLGALLNGTHFILLRQLSAGLDILVIMVALVLARESRDLSLRFPIAFIGIFTVITVATWHGGPSLLSWLASVLSVLGMFSQDNRRMRRTLGAASSVWVVHNAIVGSPVATLKELVILISAVVGYQRNEASTQKNIGRH